MTIRVFLDEKLLGTVVENLSKLTKKQLIEVITKYDHQLIILDAGDHLSMIDEERDNYILEEDDDEDEQEPSL
jgi:hypothetical protein